jgi:hypothetical protein
LDHFQHHINTLLFPSPSKQKQNKILTWPHFPISHQPFSLLPFAGKLFKIVFCRPCFASLSPILFQTHSNKLLQFMKPLLLWSPMADLLDTNPMAYPQTLA